MLNDLFRTTRQLCFKAGSSDGTSRAESATTGTACQSVCLRVEAHVLFYFPQL